MDEVTKAYNKLCEYTSSELRKNGEVHITVDYLSKLFNFKNMKDVFYMKVKPHDFNRGMT